MILDCQHYLTVRVHLYHMLVTLCFSTQRAAVEELAEKEALRKAKVGSKRQDSKKRKSSSSANGDDFQDLTLLLSKLSAPDNGASVVKEPLNADGSALAEITLTTKQKAALKAQVSSFLALCGSSSFVQAVYWPVATSIAPIW
jgi:poly-D-alanine transfer protein DltD